MTKEGTKPTLVCIDFDHTIVNGHLHNALAGGVAAEQDEVGVFDAKKYKNHSKIYNSTIDKLFARNDIDIRDDISQNIKTLIGQGHNIAITSFSKYPAGIYHVLKTQLTLDDNELGKIKIIAGFPKGGEHSENRKQEHIAAALKAFNMKTVPPVMEENVDPSAVIVDPSAVMLIDDSKPNITKAQSAGMRVAHIDIQDPKTSWDKAVFSAQELAKEFSPLPPLPKEKNHIKKIAKSIISKLTLPVDAVSSFVKKNLLNNKPEEGNDFSRSS